MQHPAWTSQHQTPAHAPAAPSSATLPAHHAQARKVAFMIDQQLQQLESGHDTSLAMQSQISQNLNALAREIQQLEELVQLEPSSQRPIWKKRLGMLKDQSGSQRAALEKFAGRAAAQCREREMRDSLLQRRNPDGGDHHAITIDAQGAMAREARYLSDAGAQLDEISANASASLHALSTQRGTIKGVQRKVLDMATKLGLSNNVLRMIERRQFWDKLIVYGGMALTLALLWFVFYRLRR
jgi:Golgi SNAP receptor complex protein 2